VETTDPALELRLRPDFGPTFLMAVVLQVIIQTLIEEVPILANTTAAVDTGLDSLPEEHSDTYSGLELTQPTIRISPRISEVEHNLRLISQAVHSLEALILLLQKQHQDSVALKEDRFQFSQTFALVVCVKFYLLYLYLSKLLLLKEYLISYSIVRDCILKGFNNFIRMIIIRIPNLNWVFK